MKLQYATFLLPLHSGSAEQEELNRFLRGHRVVQTRKELTAIDGASNGGNGLPVYAVCTNEQLAEIAK
ncbi:MAG: hypothetical protein LBU88_09685 [Treponema sp.]|jgi:hypothetical protein|nr:hypothetical protein [Treponema sp.]